MGWIDDLEKEKRRSTERREQDGEAMGFAEMHAPGMAARLADRLKSDAEEAARKLAVRIVVELDTHKIHIKHDGGYPTFFLGMDIPRRGVPHQGALLHCRTTLTKNQSSKQTEEQRDIQIVCSGSDNCLYRIEGNDLSAADASEALLKPLLKELTD